MKLVHINWQLVGEVGVIDDDGEMQVLQRSDGEIVKSAKIVAPIARFRSEEIEAAFSEAQTACNGILAQVEKSTVAAAIESLEGGHAGR